MPLAAGQGLNQEKVSVTLSAFLLSVLSGNTPLANAADRGSDVMHQPQTPSPSRDEEELRRCKIYRKSFPMTEIALPATALRNRGIAKWVRDHRVTIDVRTGEELATALAAGVRLQRLTLYADALSESELHAAVNLGVGRVVAASVQQIELMRSVVAKRAQDFANHAQGHAGDWLDKSRELFEEQTQRLMSAFEAGRDAMREEIRRGTESHG